MDPTEPDQLEQVAVGGLFGHRDFEVKLDPDEPTILTGSNGSGKSTILRMIDAFCTGSWRSLHSQPFESLRIDYRSGRRISVERVDRGLRVSTKGHKAWTYRHGQDRGVFRYLPDWESVRFTDPDTGSVTVFDPEVFEGGHREYLTLASTLAPVATEQPEWVSELIARVPVLFVTDQRLMIEMSSKAGRREKEIEKARRVADEAVYYVKAAMSSALSEYAAVSQRLDRNFPQRVVDAMRKGVTISDEALAEQLRSNEEDARALQRVGLLPDDVEIGALTDFEGETEKPVIATFAEDTAQKLDVLAPLRSQLTLLANFLDQHYRDKTVTFDADRGFFLSTPGRELEPRNLSSGEQQILVLAYQVLFRAAPGTLVLIDEPELSLHVVWQATFVDDMRTMGQGRNLRFLLATHSPTLLAGREDLRRSMDAVIN